MMKLHKICEYRKESISVSDINPSSYISTDCMLPDKAGISGSSTLPNTAKVTRYCKGDVLISNIRPYFEKIWLADKNGGCSNDILVFKPIACSSEYLYWVLSGNKFFSYMTATSKGTKMPRGDKHAIMEFELPANNESVRHAICTIMGPIKAKIELNNQLNDYLAA